MKFEFQSSTVYGTCYAVLALYFRVRVESFCKNKGGMMVKALEKTIKEEHILLTAVDSTLRIREDLGRWSLNFLTEDCKANKTGTLDLSQLLYVVLWDHQLKNSEIQFNAYPSQKFWQETTKHILASLTTASKWKNPAPWKQLRISPISL